MESHTSICDFWLPVRGREDYLMVSASGVIRSLDRQAPRSDTGTMVAYTGRALVAIPDRRGYPRIRGSMGGNKFSLRVHRAVAEAFIPNYNELPQVNHISGIKHHNGMSNLEWSTNGDNQTHAIATGLKVIETGKKAIRFERSVAVYKNGEYVITLSGNQEMAECGYDYRLVSACLLGKRKSHRGCTFIAIKKENT